ncbi:malto-oligosyltrehalose synthase [Humidisolicoccus flavus]|uniref:malto-oligosyltrehalose synthase n=1 Tax=Humidisolicoccus flavus TaxID=3111414 RepID=UPI003255D6F3
MAAPTQTPQSTYRLQLSKDFTLHDAAAVLPQLRRLGIDWVYLSPILQATRGSSHGYDVVDHGSIDEERGGADGLLALSTEARRLGMGVLVDIVPNHVGVQSPRENGWWWDVLRHGQDSQFARCFDIDWAAGAGKLVIPVLGDDDVRDDGAVANLRLEKGELWYHDNRYPLAPGSEQFTDANEALAAQHYRLAHWKEADAGLNYRRFFAVSTLAAIRVEDPVVFEASHAEIRRWFAEGLVDGLRVDHPDGLADPQGYLRDLAKLTNNAYVLVEKILEPGEELAEQWATAGTTGYDSLGAIDRVLTAKKGKEPLEALSMKLRGAEEPLDWAAMIHGTKRTIADTILRSEVLRIDRDLQQQRGFVPEQSADAIAELLACFPVYRSYLPLGRDDLGDAAKLAKQWRPDLADAIEDLVPLLANPKHAAAVRFQQTSGMVMAKGVEDTAFYRYARLTSLNEVGGDPSEFSLDTVDFHSAMAHRQREWPNAMNALSTHDTKRGEDVRARITTISEVPETWEGMLDRLMVFAPLQDREFSNLMLQAVVGAWPASRDRLLAYAEKASREASTSTQWTAPNEEYEAALHGLIDSVFDIPDARKLIEDFVAFVDEGWRSNALSAKLLNLTIPGVPDVYQGSELWEQSLVDPDNRRPIDFAELAAKLERLESEERPVFSEGALAKLHIVNEALQLRQRKPEFFSRYDPILARGEQGTHVVAFDRGGAVTVVTREPISLAREGGWGDTSISLPEGHWRCVLSGSAYESGSVPMTELLRLFPVALLERVEER